MVVMDGVRHKGDTMNENIKDNMPVVNMSDQVKLVMGEVDKLMEGKKESVLPKDVFEKLGLYRTSMRLELCRRGFVIDRFFGAAGAKIFRVQVG